MAVLTSIGSQAQTTLPTYFDFSTSPATLPDGWTTNTTAYYSSGMSDQSGGTSRAGKLQSQNHHFTISFYDEPGTMTYHLKSYGTNSFAGTLLVQESVNGTSWNTLATFGNNSFNNSWTQFSTTPDTSSRYVRFILTNKVSGTNAGIDDVTIPQNITSEQEMNVVFDGANVPSTTAITFAEEIDSTKLIKLGIENLGTFHSLALGSASISGSASAEYSIVAAPDTVDAVSADTMIIAFTPNQSGSRNAQLSIPNNDQNENPYIIELEGIGGLSASEPVNAPSHIEVNYLTTWRINASIADAGADGYLVLYTKDASVNATPVDGTNYERGQGLGNAKVAKADAGSFFRLKSTSANTSYSIRVYAYNGSGSLVNYKTDEYLDTVLVTPVHSMQNNNYYQNVDAWDPQFVFDLYSVINPHSIRYYSNYDEDMVPGLLARDTVNGQFVITGVYSGDNVVYSAPFAWPSTNMNREHTLPSSWMPTAGNSNTAEYQDYHHLFPTIATANGQRSNRPLGEVQNVTSSYGQGKAGTNASGQSVYEPREPQKGDAARAILYMMTTYGWSQSDLQSNGPQQDLNLLVDWHLDDLPSPWEVSRNDYLDSLQGNRNPFVDSAHWVCFINFESMTYNPNPDSTCLERAGYQTTPVDTSDTSGVGVAIPAPNAWVLYPNPATSVIYVQGKHANSFAYELRNALGILVARGRSESGGAIDVSALPSGSYFFRITAQGGNFTKHIVVSQH